MFLRIPTEGESCVGCCLKATAFFFVAPFVALRGPRNAEALSKGPAISYTDTPFSADRKVCESMNVQKKVRGSISLLAMRTDKRGGFDIT